MSEEEINILRGLVYQYCNEPRNTYMGGQTIITHELNKAKFEALSGFVNWIKPTSTDKKRAAAAPQEPSLNKEQK